MKREFSVISLIPGISGADGTPLFALNNKHKSLRRAFTLDDGATQYALIERPNTASTCWGGVLTQ